VQFKSVFNDDFKNYLNKTIDFHNYADHMIQCSKQVENASSVFLATTAAIVSCSVTIVPAKRTISKCRPASDIFAQSTVHLNSPAVNTCAAGSNGYHATPNYGWWRGVAATHCVESTKLLYGGPG